MSKKRIQQLELKVQELINRLNTRNDENLTEVWLDSADIKQLFHFSDSKLYRLRKANKIPHELIGGTYVYPKSYFTKTLLQKIKNREKME